jgi:putative transposase
MINNEFALKKHKGPKIKSKDEKTLDKELYSTLTEKHVIKSSGLLDMCHKGKDLYNCGLYTIRQSFCKPDEQRAEAKMLFYKDTYKLLKDSYQYKALPTVASQQILMELDKNFKSYFKAIKDWQKNKSKYLGMPKLPKYKDKNGFVTLSFPGQAFVKINNGLTIPKTKVTVKTTTKVTKQNIIQVRIVPLNNETVKVEVVYKDANQILNLTKENCIGIDIGVNNLAALVSNNETPIVKLINGKPLKSINQFYNKERARLKSSLELCQKKKTSKRLRKLYLKRENKIDDYLHKASKKVIDICIENNIGTIIIGHNKEWKQDINLGKRINQNFVNIPFNKLIQNITYKGKLVGINTETTEESYTSKTDHLMNEPMQRNDKPSGKRTKRGLFLSGNGKVINTDINGGIGMLRKKKVVSESWLNKVGNRGEVYSPVKVTLF